jgi:CBS domain-containing protein
MATAATLLAGTGCSGLPVVDPEGRVIGLVTETDLVRHRLTRTGSDAVVREVMTEQPLLAPADHDLDALVGLMLAAGTPVVPLVHGRRLVGSVDLRDLVGLIGLGGARTPEPRRASGQ